MAKKWKSWNTNPTVRLLIIATHYSPRIAILCIQDFDGIVSGEKFFVSDVNFWGAGILLILGRPLIFNNVGELKENKDLLFHRKTALRKMCYSQAIFCING